MSKCTELMLVFMCLWVTSHWCYGGTITISLIGFNNNDLPATLRGNKSVVQNVEKMFMPKDVHK